MYNITAYYIAQSYALCSDPSVHGTTLALEWNIAIGLAQKEVDKIEMACTHGTVYTTHDKFPAQVN